MGRGHILIVDDEESRLRSFAAVLGNEGFKVSCSGNGNDVLACMSPIPPDVVLLELWLPGMDGVEVLQAIKRCHADTEVIVMSGHGNIATAVKVIKLGAFDYIEKPCAPESVLQTVYRALNRRQPDAPRQLTHTPPHATAFAASMPPVTSSMPWQKTLRRSVVLRGQGLQSGSKTGMILSPLPPASGIMFRDLTTGATVPALIDYVACTDFCTSLRKGRAVAKTIEHLMSVLHAYGITNLLITISDEVPIMDGSATDFCQLVETTGLVEQEAVAESYTVAQRYHVGEMSLQTKFICVEPYDGFRVTYRVNYPPPIGIQEWTYEHRNSASYRSEIAPARTFAFVKDVEAMHELGLVAGGRLNNVILLDEAKIVNSTPLRFANECVRHKVLDIIGDLYLLGMTMRGHVRANMTGHTENVALVRTLRAAMCPS